MTRTLLTAVAALALVAPAGFATAQDAVASADASGSVTLTADQQTIYDGWPADRRTSYDTWPNTYRVYYWTLTPEQQTGWWALTDAQRGQVYALTAEQRTAAWASITAQLSGAAPATVSADAASASDDATMSADTSAAMTSADAGMATASDAGMASTTMASGPVQFVRRETTQPVAASADAAALASGDLPVCAKDQQDGCINRADKGKAPAAATTQE